MPLEMTSIYFKVKSIFLSVILLMFDIDFYSLFQETMNVKCVPIAVGIELYEVDGCFSHF